MSLGFSAACMVGLNMYLLSNTLGRAFTNDNQVLQVRTGTLLCACDSSMTGAVFPGECWLWLSLTWLLLTMVQYGPHIGIHIGVTVYSATASRSHQEAM